MGQAVNPLALRLAPEIGAAAIDGRVRTVGPLLLACAPTPADGERALGCAPGLLVRYVALHFLPAGRVRPADGAALPCAAGDVLMVDAAERWFVTASADAECRTLFAPRASIAPALPARPRDALTPGSGGLAAAGRHLAMLLDDGATGLTPAQEELAARALLALVLAAIAADERQPSPRRAAGLLERAVAAIDRAPAAILDTAGLCAALGCSRSALYRATAPAGGVAALIVQRRLIAVRRRLGDAADARPIAAIAREHGFEDAARFGRHFKRQFGLTAGTYRESLPADRPAAGDAAACG